MCNKHLGSMPKVFTLNYKKTYMQTYIMIPASKLKYNSQLLVDVICSAASKKRLFFGRQ